ncbi:MAG: hypothetical protein ACNI3C_10820 [Candidatus Marinarcus sp.]|uniref:hypothetical protein n=1 Tax=Candidatus Marinarcus sp. TaxID=3100987 RepID=UPI003B0006F6
MEQFQAFAKKQFNISLIFFALGMIAGIIYSINLLGYAINSNMLMPSNIRSIHISLMLYGFIPLMLSYLPFFIISKEQGISSSGLRYLQNYTYIWYIFLIYMVIALLFGNTRGLAFYDFPYELNFILAFAGLFYIIALFKFVSLYKVFPLWIKISLFIVIIAPFLLLILMNPTIGQVEATISGPHGDNTLGMSFAIIPLYYLVIKYLNQDEFKARWHIFWIIPFIFYALSVVYKSFIAELTYNQEWFLQYLTLFYVPLLYRWYQDSKIKKEAKLLLLISIMAFLFVDIEGNILFIPEFRWVFHRNDLVVGHAHIAMGVSILFLVLPLYANFIKPLQNKLFARTYLIGMCAMVLMLSFNGFVETGMLNLNSEYLWTLRTLFGAVILYSLSHFIHIKLDLSRPLKRYHLFGMLSDGLTGISLFLLADFLYPILNFKFGSTYEYVVFGFVFTTGLIHYFGYKYTQYEYILALITMQVRVLISAIFFALYASKTLGYEAFAIAFYDLTYALIFLILFQKMKEESK